jgi:membrane protease YdiL (CAAX protease family)
MSFLALSPLQITHGTVVLLDNIFYIATLACFIRVAAYALAQQREHALINGLNAPPRLAIRSASGWCFAACVLALLFLQSPLYMVLVLAGIFGLLVETGRTATEQFGLARLRPARLIAWSLLLCGAVIFVELPLGALVDRGMDALNVPHPEQESVDLFRHLVRPSDVAFFLLQAAVVAPLLEELFFRGFLFTFLKNYTSTGLALVLSAGVFAFAHVNLGSVLQLWLLGIILGLAYEHTGSLLLPIGIHACWNFITAMSLLLDRGGS